MAEIKVAKKTIFFPGKDSWSSPQIITQGDFHIGQVLINKYGLKLDFGYSTYRGKKRFFRCVPPPLHQANPFSHHCSFTLHTSYTNGMLDEGGGEGCQKAEKRITVPAHQVTHFHIFCLNL